MACSVPSPDFSTGFDVEEKSFKWAIKNYPYVREEESIINSQLISFTAGATTGHPTQWEVYLKEYTEDGKRWIGFYLQLKSPHPPDPILNAMYAQVRCIVKNWGIFIIADKEIEPIQAKSLVDGGEGIGKFLDPDGDDFSQETLVIDVTFKLRTSSPLPQVASSLEAIMEKFRVAFLKKRREDFVRLLEIPDACSDIKIISKDEEEFSMQKGMLAVRSEVFAAMLRSDLEEGKSGVINLSDIHSEDLKVVLHFLEAGALLPEWREAGVIVELANAAAQYELKDLLQFLDETMGKVCQLENVQPLLFLARQLSLKVAEEELMAFERKERIASGKRPAPAGKKGRKRRKNRRW